MDLIKVLIVEDSPLASKLLTFIINSDPGMQVIGCVESGEEALEFIQTIKPDVITMDIVLPKMDGFEATHQIMQTNPIPIIIVSANYQKDDIDNSFKAINVGALDILEKPSGPRDPHFQSMANALTQSIKNAAKTNVLIKHPASPLIIPAKEKVINHELPAPIQTEAIAIGASLGGPKALKVLLSQLPAQFPIPILLVQHISPGFTKGFADWLKTETSLMIKLAEDQEIIEPGCVYVAPENYHLEVAPNHTIHLSEASPEGGLRPSLGRLFRSMANTYGSKGIGIVLTGMGRDGADELLLMKNKGALTIAQDQESSLIFGMPKEAIAIGAASYVLSLQQIADFLNSLAN